MIVNEFNELVAKAVSRGVKEGVLEQKMNAMEMVGVLEFQKNAILAEVLKTAIRAQQPAIVVAPTGFKVV